MYTVITILIILTCVLLVLVVLVQNPKGGGISSGIIGTNQVMGVKKTTDFIEKLTWGLALTLVILSLFASLALPNKEERGIGTSMQEQIDMTGGSMPAQNQPANKPATPAQNQPAPAQQQEPAKK